LQAEAGSLSLETALGLFGLKHHMLLWEQTKCDTKCLVAWGDGTIVVAFRGTASMANLMLDIKVCMDLYVQLAHSLCKYP
jgi:hypothetical protein